MVCLNCISFRGSSTDQYSHLIANSGISYKLIIIKSVKEYGIVHHKLVLITVICCLACKFSPICSVCIACYKTSMF